MIEQVPFVERQARQAAGLCPHRTVSKDGRIVCAKIERGDNAVSPQLCHGCPVRAVNCAHLRFSLCHSSPSPLVVRCNGHTEVWDGDPAQVRFQQAACAARVVPIHHSQACASCPLRQPLQAGGSAGPRPAVSCPGKVVPFPLREPLAAAG